MCGCFQRVVFLKQLSSGLLLVTGMYLCKYYLSLIIYIHVYPNIIVIAWQSLNPYSSKCPYTNIGMFCLPIVWLWKLFSVRHLSCILHHGKTGVSVCSDYRCENGVIDRDYIYTSRLDYLFHLIVWSVKKCCSWRLHVVVMNHFNTIRVFVCINKEQTYPC